MKNRNCFITVLILVLLTLCLTCVSATARESNPVNRFPDEVIEVPQGTEIIIDDNNQIVTIVDCPVTISDGNSHFPHE